jgi:hypothetical protein
MKYLEVIGPNESHYSIAWTLNCGRTKMTFLNAWLSDRLLCQRRQFQSVPINSPLEPPPAAHRPGNRWCTVCQQCSSPCTRTHGKTITPIAIFSVGWNMTFGFVTVLIHICDSKQRFIINISKWRFTAIHTLVLIYPFYINSLCTW